MINFKSLVFLPLTMFAAGLTLSAAEPEDMVGRFVKSIEGHCVSVGYAYSTLSSGIRLTGSGEVTFQDSSFILEGDGLEVYCDGVVKWTVDRSSCEAVIESVDAEQPDYLAYPVLMAKDVRQVFDVVSESKSDFNGSDAVKVSLIPKTDLGNIVSANLFFRPSGIVPAGLVLEFDDGSDIRMVFNEFSVSDRISADRFSFDAGSLSEDYIVTDMR